jgi:hypothetical protein
MVRRLVLKHDQGVEYRRDETLTVLWTFADASRPGRWTNVITGETCDGENLAAFGVYRPLD